MLQEDPIEAVKGIYMIHNLVCAKDRPKEAVESIYIMHNSICARCRPRRTVKAYIQKLGNRPN